ncbi:hypothetical protein V8E36_004109 [Tilletia maclaganii]
MAAQPSSTRQGTAAATAPNSSGFSLGHTVSPQSPSIPGEEDKERTKQSLKAWWSAFTSSRNKQQQQQAHNFNPASSSAAAAAAAAAAGAGHGSNLAGGAGLPAGMGKPGGVFGVPLRTSLKYASVAISMAAEDGKEYVWGYIPVIVAKVGLYLKENATQVEGVFRIAGSQKRMKELQDIFDSPPRYGKSVDWSKFSVHDAASVLRRYLNHMPEPIVPLNLYSEFKNVLLKQPFDVASAIRTYRLLITSMPAANQYLLLYVLDLLAVFARESDKNLMPPSNLAVIFQPGIFSHPSHLQNPAEHKVAVEALEFMITHQDHFVLGLSPPPPPNVRPEDLTGVSKPLSPVPQSATGIQAEDVLLPSDSDEEQDVAAFKAHRGGGAERAAAAAAAAAAAEEQNASPKSGRRSGGKTSTATNLSRSLSASAKSPRRFFGGGNSGNGTQAKNGTPVSPSSSSKPRRGNTSLAGTGGGAEMTIGEPVFVDRGPSDTALGPAASVPMGLSRSAGPFAGTSTASRAAVASSPRPDTGPGPGPSSGNTGIMHETGLGIGTPTALSEAPIPAGPPPIISPPSTPPAGATSALGPGPEEGEGTGTGTGTGTPVRRNKGSPDSGSAGGVQRSKTTPTRRRGPGDVSVNSALCVDVQPSAKGKGAGVPPVPVVAKEGASAGAGAGAGGQLTPPSSKVLASARDTAAAGDKE